MPSIELTACAKLNLTLDVLGRRSDGYHDLRMVMQSVALCDRILLEIGTNAPLRVATNRAFLPNDARNLAAVAALNFARATGTELGGVAIQIQKSIPVCAGLAGGSTDGAAVLRGLNVLTGERYRLEELADIGRAVGSDVPYCVLGGTALAEGRGEVLTKLAPLPHCFVTLCKPNFSISTPELFARLDGVRLCRHPDTAGVTAALTAGDLGGVARRMYNVFEDVLPRRQAGEIAEIKAVFIRHGALGAGMSGTGPTVFGIFTAEAAARAAYEELHSGYQETFQTETV